MIHKTELRWPGIEPGSTAWKAAMLTTIPPSLWCKWNFAANSAVNTDVNCCKSTETGGAEERKREVHQEERRHEFRII